MAMLDEQQVKEKVLRYEGFISDVLQRDLQKVLEQRDEVYEKIAQYLQLKSVIERLQETGNRELVTQVDLGCNFYVNAEVLLILTPSFVPGTQWKKIGDTVRVCTGKKH
uniref:Uncharacterized protein n=1 Tax=Sphaerodactylus townsendi TaxID=933632 RepID=A0ACB8EM93_9SAUR